jgi:hypothetical protein
MKKWLLGLLLGGFLGIFDGLSALISAPNDPDVQQGIIGIVIGSTIKGIIAGYLIGYFAQRVQSLPLGILFGLLVGGFLAFLIVLSQYFSLGKFPFWEIMLPGSLVGVIVGYVTQRHGAPVAKPA